LLAIHLRGFRAGGDRQAKLQCKTPVRIRHVASLARIQKESTVRFHPLEASDSAPPDMREEIAQYKKANCGRLVKTIMRVPDACFILIQLSGKKLRIEIRLAAGEKIMLFCVSLMVPISRRAASRIKNTPSRQLLSTAIFS